ncbi:hypothetical protein L3Y34_008601 [Caenorhabditis briggsae]|uniref:Serpentine receptor class gamma n=1 Tax=Caenorhabditis briggsae TaxID=6238 RepID=A0AAE9A9S7_CAEBR|nr:hypothetical protein L3Y34_008601 [Caenorhabditis briggsae]
MIQLIQKILHKTISPISLIFKYGEITSDQFASRNTTINVIMINYPNGTEKNRKKIEKEPIVLRLYEKICLNAHRIVEDTFLMIMSLPNTLSFAAYLLANFGFAIYRTCIVFDLLRYCLRIVQMVTLYLPWILAIYTVIDTTSRGCIKRFNRWFIGYTYNCSSCNVWFGFSFIDVNFYAGQVLPILMCIMYGVMIANIYWKKTHSNGKSKKFQAFDVKLAFQYLLVCLIQYLASFLFYIVPKVGNGSLIALIAMNIIGVIDMGLNPLILLIFNARIRFSTALLFQFIPCLRVKQANLVNVTIQRCIIPHVVIFSILTPSIGVWTVFLSESQFVPFQGGFTPETKMAYNWITVSQFSVIISSITICVAVICSLISMVCMSRTRSENKHTQQSLTASALCQSIFYVLVHSMEIYFHKSKPSSLETAEFWNALTAFSFDILLVSPPIIMLCLNVRLRVDVFVGDSGNPLTSPK